ncbi:MAG: hypothetical protein A2Y25_09080 [Candidatus Melainabacteria bacterium GWF2_37_15]|nr:MAG: hypothetical protein A2Y25_09080 [Candidatus Melainabacteria bacterium GWF2_37_15]
METDIRKKLAAKIIELRKARGFSQEDLAFKAQIDRSYMSRIERGLVSTGIINLEKIARALEIKPYELLKFD